MSTSYRSAIALSALLAALGPSLSTPANAQVLAIPNASNGNGYGEWGARWWQWLFSIPAKVNPNVAAGAVDCSIGQAGDVWFLGGAFGGAVSRSCSVPAGKSLFFPLVNVVAYRPKAQDTLNVLRQQADGFIGSVPAATLTCMVDEAPCAGGNGAALIPYRATTPSFSVLPPSSGVLIPPGKLVGPGANDTFVADGYWILLRPLSPGQEHTISFGAAWGPGPLDQVNVTYKVTVQPFLP